MKADEVGESKWKLGSPKVEGVLMSLHYGFDEEALREKLNYLETAGELLVILFREWMDEGGEGEVEDVIKKAMGYGLRRTMVADLLRMYEVWRDEFLGALEPERLMVIGFSDEAKVGDWPEMAWVSAVAEERRLFSWWAGIEGAWRSGLEKLEKGTEFLVGEDWNEGWVRRLIPISGEDGKRAVVKWNKGLFVFETVEGYFDQWAAAEERGRDQGGSGWELEIDLREVRALLIARGILPGRQREWEESNCFGELRVLIQWSNRFRYWARVEEGKKRTSVFLEFRK